LPDVEEAGPVGENDTVSRIEQPRSINFVARCCETNCRPAPGVSRTAEYCAAVPLERSKQRCSSASPGLNRVRRLLQRRLEVLLHQWPRPPDLPGLDVSGLVSQAGFSGYQHGNLHAWLMTIMTNTAINTHRSHNGAPRRCSPRTSRSHRPSDMERRATGVPPNSAYWNPCPPTHPNRATATPQRTHNSLVAGSSPARPTSEAIF
jgi:hypothetical protein